MAAGLSSPFARLLRLGLLLTLLWLQAAHGTISRSRQLKTSYVVVTTPGQLRKQIEGSATDIVIGKSFVLPGNLPAVTRKLTIRGSTVNCRSEDKGRCTLRGNYKCRHFIVYSGGRLTLRNLVLKTGKGLRGGSVYVTGHSFLSATNVYFGFNYAYGVLYGGGAIEADQGSTLSINNCTFERNAAGFGAAIDAVDGSGVWVRNTLFHKNTAGVGGGAISLLLGAKAYVFHGRLSENKAPTGGAVYVNSAFATLCGMKADGNSATVSGSKGYVTSSGKITYCGMTSDYFVAGSGGQLVYGCTRCY